MTSKIYIDDIRIIIRHINDCMSQVGDIEKNILSLESNSDDMSLIDDLYNNISIIGRGFSFFGLYIPVKIVYEMKFIFDKIKVVSETVITEYIDILLIALDLLNLYLNRLYEYLQNLNLLSDDQVKYIEFSTVLKEDQILDSLEEFHKKCEVENKKEKSESATVIDNTYDELMHENFQNELAEDIKEQFLYENAEHLELIENNILIRLDIDKNDNEAINEIFRAIHSIKAGAGLYLSTLTSDDTYYEYTKNFIEVVHNFESLLSMVRDKQYVFDKDLMDLCFKVVDYLKTYNQFVGLGYGSIDNYEDVIDSINFELSNIQQLPIIPRQNNILIDQEQENKTENIKPTSSTTQTIRVHQDKIDNIINMTSELVVAKSAFSHIYNIINNEYHLPDLYREIRQVGDYVNRLTDKLQSSIMSIRMVEIRTVFQKMHRVVRDIAQNNGKNIELIMEGEETEIDKSIIEYLSDPLMHIIRNCADHGIETYEERIKLGKPGKGKIVLRAYNKSKHVFIEVKDDGQGIDPVKIKRKAIEKGLLSESEANNMNNKQLINLIFMPGFSTAEHITEISGRGVGMDIVKSNISKINGSVTVESEVGKGTKMTIKLPLSLAFTPISHGLVVECEGSDYLIPLESIVETVKINRNNIHYFKDKYFTYLRGAVIGVEWLSKMLLLGERDMEKEELNAVILTNGIKNVAIIVDKLKNEQEFVIKPLEGHLSSITGILGSTIFSNGKIVLIVNSSDILKLAGL